MILLYSIAVIPIIGIPWMFWEARNAPTVEDEEMRLRALYVEVTGNLLLDVHSIPDFVPEHWGIRER